MSGATLAVLQGGAVLFEGRKVAQIDEIREGTPVFHRGYSGNPTMLVELVIEDQALYASIMQGMMPELTVERVFLERRS